MSLHGARAFALFAVLSTHAAATEAWAGRHDLQLVNLCPQAATSSLGVHECSWVRRGADGLIQGLAIDSEGRGHYRSLMSELGVVFAPRIPMAADSLGFAGFRVSAELAFTEISRSRSYWDGVRAVSPQSPTAARPDPVLTTVGVFLRKGLWFPTPGFEMGGGVVNLLESQLLSWQGYAKLALHEGFHDLPFPSLAVRGAVSYLTGTDEVSLRTVSIDVLLSKGFGLFKTVRVEPFGGWSALLIKATGRIVDFTPLCDGYAVANATPGQQVGAHCAASQSGTANDLVGNVAFPAQDTITRYRVFGGAKLKFGLLALIAQYEVYLPGHSRDEDITPAVDRSARQSSVSLSAGLEF